MKRMAAAAVIVLLLAAQAAWSLTVPDQSLQPLSLDQPVTSITGNSLPALYLYRAPKDDIASIGAGLMLYGGATSFDIGGQSGSGYKGGLYFSRSAISANALGTRRNFQSGDPAGALGLQAILGGDNQHTVRSSTAVWQDLAYKGARWNLTASHRQVASDFEGLSDLVSSRPDAALLQSLLGMETTNMDFNLQPGKGMSLTSHYERSVNDKPNDKNRGLVQSATKNVLALALGPGTQLTGSYEASSKEKDQLSERKQLSTFSLSHDFGGGFLGSVTRQLTTSAKNGAVSSVAATLGHFEYKPSGRLALTADLAEKTPDGGAPERSSTLGFNTLLGQGTGQMALSGQWQQKIVGEGDKTTQDAVRLGLVANKNPLLQFALNYQSHKTDGPDGASDNSKMDATITSQVSKYGKLVAQTLTQTASGKTVRSEQKVRFELTPGALSLNAGFEQLAADGVSPGQMAFAHLLLRTGKPLAGWAKQATGPVFLPGADRYGLRTNIPWAAVPDSGVEMHFLSRSAGQDGGADTRMIGYQTMVGRSAYLKLALQDNPLEKKDKDTPLHLRRNLAEFGLRVGPRLSLITRALNEADLSTGSSVQTRMIALRSQPAKRLSILVGRQDVQADSLANMSFLSLEWKRAAMPEWARNIATSPLFPDADQFGFRRPPAWAAGDSGLRVQHFLSSGEDGSGLQSYGVAYQTMLGRSAYLKLASLRNPLDNNKNVVPVRQSMWEMGAQAGGKWTLLLRGVQEENLGGDRMLSSYVMGVRSNLSDREKLEATISVDKVTGESASHRRGLGVEYSRWISAEHMLSLKGFYSQDQQGGNDDLHWELAFRKHI